MKLRLLTIISITLILVSWTPTLAFSESVTATIPDFEITVNSLAIDVQHSEYPPLAYNGITYFPMTRDYTFFTGLELRWDNQSGLKINRLEYSDPNLPAFSGGSNILGSSRIVTVAPFNITVNGKKINNKAETYPILTYNNITYFPMTWRFASNEFGWATTWSEAEGLVISSGTWLSPEGGKGFNGSGYVEFKHGDQSFYKGQWLNGKRTGYGIMDYGNGPSLGLRYEGNWKDDIRSGNGKLFNRGGTQLIYEGQWENNQYNGIGKMFMENGSIYEGEFKSGKFSGHGTLYYPDHRKLEANWQDNVFMNPVKYSYGDYRYEGDLRNGLREGYGKLYKNEVLLYDGEWCNDEFVNGRVDPSTIFSN